MFPVIGRSASQTRTTAVAPVPDATGHVPETCGGAIAPRTIVLPMFTDDVAATFPRVPGWCNTATVGLPPRRAVAALRASLDAWETGTLDTVGFDVDVEAARAGFAALVGTSVDRVAMPGAVSITAGLVASCLPDGARVLCASEDFTSVLYPFLADDRLDVVSVPLAELVDSIDARVDLVAASIVQSADGRVLDQGDLATAASRAGARTFVDLTQAAGWLPIDADRFDVTACSAYKWLCSPRGVGFMSVRDDVDWMVPRLAGWYASDSPWTSCYGPPLRVAPDARRFTISPAWFDVRATAIALETIGGLGVESIHAHDVALANRFLAALDLPPSDSAIVSVATGAGAAAALAEAGIATAVRAGRTRLSFHAYSTDEDADRAAAVLRPHLAT